MMTNNPILFSFMIKLNPCWKLWRIFLLACGCRPWFLLKSTRLESASVTIKVLPWSWKNCSHPLRPWSVVERNSLGDLREQTRIWLQKVLGGSDYSLRKSTDWIPGCGYLQHPTQSHCSSNEHSKKSCRIHLEFRTHFPIETSLQLGVRFPGQETNAPLTPNVSITVSIVGRT